ncbi:MAG: Rieske 2Fe-2S domain-containing protein [SAR202 cluster bacterium]|nr:Rieske 2Fe-2S domain-containing protein [SAR202 cluster bacterium]
MLTREENELMSRTDKGTPMGEFCRRFWTPVLLSEELPEPDCAPVQTKIYGEELVAFRTTSGKVGLLKEFCPHRHASLFYGRNEEEGLRCAYHGWKFDTEGQCVDMMSEPAESNFANKVTTTAYPTQEGAGFIWAYMGPPELQPPMPELEYLHVPENQRQTNKVFYESNFVQVIEGEIDTVHASILHSRLDSLENSGSAATLAGRYSFRDRAARFHVEDTDGGILIGANRNAEEDSYYWRISRWLFPWVTMIPREPKGPCRSGLIVPVDDENCWFFLVRWDPYKPLEGPYNEAPRDGMVPGTWLGMANKTNHYLIDREAQRTESFSGIPNSMGRAQDAAMTDSMGAIVDRTEEHLGTTDAAIIRMRRRLIQGARDLQEGIEPYAASHPEVFKVRSGGALLPRNIHFTDDADVLADITVK